MGPVEYIVIGFEGNRFNGDVAPALQALVESGIINILDLVFIQKDADGHVIGFELDQWDDAAATIFESIDGEVGYLVSETDLALAAEALPNNTAAGIVVWENVWAERFAKAVVGSGGKLYAHERIPYTVVEEALAYAAGQ